MNQPIRLADRDLKPHKATVAPTFGTRTVLTQAPWDFVDLWLRRQAHPHPNPNSDARFYWGQARIFATAAHALPVPSAPLLHYYSFMNAAKALLASKGVTFLERHGLRAHTTQPPTGQIVLAHEGVAIQNRGIFPAFAQYLGDAEPNQHHGMDELLFNLPCIHRTYCLTNSASSTDLFIPLKQCRFEFDATTSQAYFAAEISKDFNNPGDIARLPASLIHVAGTQTVRSQATAAVSGATLAHGGDLQAMATLNRQLRPDLQYIAGAETLWYAKAATAAGPRRLQRSPLSLTLAAMHRLSELCRYKPKELAQFFEGPENWLLSEFIQMSPPQYLDEIAAEITGHQVMTPNVRPAT